MGQTKHDRIAERVATRHGAEYNSSEGADVVTPGKAIEVEVDPGKFPEGKRQLQGYDQPRYLAVPNEYVQEAKEVTEGTKIGVMNERGKIVKPAGRPKK